MITYRLTDHCLLLFTGFCWYCCSCRIWVHVDLMILSEFFSFTRWSSKARELSTHDTGRCWGCDPLELCLRTVAWEQSHQSSHRRLQSTCAGTIWWMFSSLEALTSGLTSGDDDMADAALFIVYETQKSIIASLIQRNQPAKFQQLNRWGRTDVNLYIFDQPSSPSLSSFTGLGLDFCSLRIPAIIYPHQMLPLYGNIRSYY